MTGPERHLRRLMALYSIVYFAFGVLLLVSPGAVYRLINRITGSLGLKHPLDEPAYPFWSTVTVSLLFTLSLACYLAWRDVSDRLPVRLMIFAKYVSSLCQITYFATSGDHPPGFLVGALTDGLLGAVAHAYLRWAGTEGVEECQVGDVGRIGAGHPAAETG